MGASRPLVNKGGVGAETMNVGDLLILSESVTAGALTTVGAGTITGAMIAAGLITRTGPVGGFTDTTDTAANIITALAASGVAPLVPGSSFRLRYMNTVAQAMTLAAGTGVTLDVTNGTQTVNVAASLWRDYVVTINNAQPPVTMQSNTTNASKVITFVLAVGRSARPEVGSNGGDNITPGMVVSGTGITAGTKVVGLTLGLGGLTGVTTDTNSTATSAVGGVALTFGPSVTFTGIGSGTA